MDRKVKHCLRTPRSCEIGHSKRKQLDPSDYDMSRELESDDMPKSCWIKEEIQRVVREELKPIKSDLKEAKKDLKLLISRLTDIFGSCIPNAVKGKKVQPICSSVKDDDTIQEEVREESEHSSSHSVQPLRSPGKRQKTDQARNLRLQFKTKLPLFVFTAQKLKIEFELVDGNTGTIVKIGPENPAEVEVVVLDGDFGTGGYDNWTHEEFEKSVVRERKEKKPLLVGTLVVNVNGGTGVLGDVQLTDNSSWTRSGKFRLGLRASPEYREIIREAITDPFRVKEQRGQSNKKHYPPLPDDDVWRLEIIGKDGPFHNKLNESGIYNVGQFLRLLKQDSKELRKILGPKMTQNKWDKLREHAETCLLDGNPHVSIDNENVHQNSRQLTDHTADQVHRAADKVSLKQENRGDTIGKASSSSPCQVSEGQTENPSPDQHNMTSRTCAAPVGPEVPPANAGSTAEGHQNGVTALPLQVDSQNTNCGDAMEFPVDASAPHGITTDGSSTRSSDIILDYYVPCQMFDTSKQMDSIGNELLLYSEPPYGPCPEGDDEWFNSLFENPANVLSGPIPPWDNGDARRQQRR